MYTANDGRVARKRLNYRLAEDCKALTGFSHGGVTPVGCLTPLPVILDSRIAALPGMFFIGAGDVDLKLSMTVVDFRRAYQPIVADVCA